MRVPVDPKQIRVQVENGTRTPGLGKRVDDALAATSTPARAPRNAADRALERTVVAFDPRWDQSAKSLAAALPGSTLKPVKGQGATLKVITGADFTRVARVRPADQESGMVVRGDEVVCGDR
ncbi:LCP family protein OS=Streptomyces tendae OX=1932 GN=GUR47_28220 PE=3 SV=1 [Streptomyces tendae]